MSETTLCSYRTELSRDRDAEILLSQVTHTNKNRCQDPLMNFQCYININNRPKHLDSYFLGMIVTLIYA